MSDYFDRVERQIVQRVEAGAPHASRRPTALGYLATAAAVAVAIVIVGVFLLAHGSNPAPTPAAGNGVTVMFTASTIDPRAQLGPAIDRSVVILRERLRRSPPASESSGTGTRSSSPRRPRTPPAHGSLVSPRPDGSRSSTGRPMRSRRTAGPSHRSSRRKTPRRSRSARAPGRQRPAIPARERCRVARQPRWPRSDPDQASSRRPLRASLSTRARSPRAPGSTCWRTSSRRCQIGT